MKAIQLVFSIYGNNEQRPNIFLKVHYGMQMHRVLVNPPHPPIKYIFVL